MKLTRKAQHAVHAVLDLAVNAPQNGGSRSLEIATRTGVPAKFLDLILLDLRRAGIVASKRGPEGGHRLAADSAKLTVGDILVAIDGAASIAAKTAPKGGSPTGICVERLWASVTEAVRGVTDHITVEDLRRQAVQRVVDYSI
jgi:Rrf2 family protein